MGGLGVDLLLLDDIDCVGVGEQAGELAVEVVCFFLVDVGVVLDGYLSQGAVTR